jgi:hypothetical protein
VRTVNSAIAQFPIETGVSYLALDMLSVVGTYALITQHLSIPVDFTIAFGISRVLRRVRLPADVAMAGVLAKAFPSLSQVHISGVWKKPAAPATSPDGTPGPETRKQRWLRAVTDVADRYGLAFMVSQRMVMSLLTVGSVYAMLRLGLDVQGYVSGLQLAPPAGAVDAAASGAAEAAPSGVLGSQGSVGANTAQAVSAFQDVAGPWAAAVCGAVLLYPGVVLGSARLGRSIGQWRKHGFKQ